jgi:hypothetical protein
MSAARDAIDALKTLFGQSFGIVVHSRSFQPRKTQWLHIHINDNFASVAWHIHLLFVFEPRYLVP